MLYKLDPCFEWTGLHKFEFNKSLYKPPHFTSRSFRCILWSAIAKQSTLVVSLLNRPFATMGKYHLIFQEWKEQVTLSNPDEFQCNYVRYSGNGSIFKSLNLIEFIALQQLFPIQILLIFQRFKLPPNFIFQCYGPQTCQFPLFFPALFILVHVFTKSQELNFVTHHCKRAIGKNIYSN